jgi:chromosome segregation ATPase
MTKIEQTRRVLYDALAKVRKAKKHPKATDALETALEEHLEGLRFEGEMLVNELKITDQRLDAMRQERDDCQERMRVIDEAYRKSQEALVIAGDELRAVQEVNGAHRIEIESLRQQLSERDATIGHLRSDDACYKRDCITAENLADDLSEKLSAATAVIGQQEQLIAGQRKAIADMHNELTHRRVICKAFMQARQAFVALDEALHEAPQSKAIRAVGDDVVDAEMLS